MVNAQATINDMSGYAWSDNIGWISFKGTVPSSSEGYKVTIDRSTGDMSGYAWSDNIGWIRFGGLSGMPDAAGNAKVNFTNGAVTGWARACAGRTNGLCLGSSGASRTDGWDGWIKLSGTNHTSPVANGTGGVTMNITTGAFTGFAWGGSVVGWVDFDTSLGMSVVCQNNCGGGTPTGGLDGICTINGIDGTDAFITLPSSGGSVNFQVSGLSGGTAPYTYHWSTYISDVTTAIPTFSETFPANFASVAAEYGLFTVDVKDKNNQEVQLYCGNVTVPANTPGDEVDLFIGRDAAHATGASLQIVQGNPFTLKWKTDLSNSYSCSGDFSPTNAEAQTKWSGWNNADIDNAEENDLSFASSKVPPGKYQFQLSCSYPSAVAPAAKEYSDTVDLIIKSSSVIEI